ncbi:MAG: metallophosphoesterase [Candidatus Auribacterota bacterium]|nr:metallophosphoesterase [Candidatus Auribacterota bacterium]
MKNRSAKLLVVMTVVGLALTGIIGFVIFDAMVLEPNWITVDRVVIRNEKLARELGDLTIVQISDLHLRNKLGFKENELIRKLNSLAPDIILVTGDLVEADNSEGLVTEFFSRLKPELWTYGILGNSDRKYLGDSGYKKIWKRSGFSLIGGTCRPMGGEDDGMFWLGGIDFPGYEFPGIEDEIDRILKPLPPGAPLIFLSYDPDLAPLLIERGADLVLSGDTHGGVIGIPGWSHLFHGFFGRSRFVRGLFEIGAGLLYVNRGIATKVLPIRFLCPPEITIFIFTA